jgi:D-glycero-alpha-D-manno-heptose-7-phosphate kinase
VVNAAIDLHTYVECIEGGGKIRLHAEDIGQRLTLESPLQLQYDGRLDLHKGALNMLPVTGGVEIISRSEVPTGSGLGASGSLDVSLVTALAHCRNETSYDRIEIAEMAFQLEAVELGLAGGRQDQYAAAHGGFHAFRFAAEGVTVRSIDLTADAIRELRSFVHVVFTGQSHFSPDTHEAVWTAYRAGNTDVCDALRTIRDLAGEAEAALAAGDWVRLAEVVDANWKHQRRLHPTIATETSEAIEKAARSAGAIGVKAAGAGAGGCLVILAPPQARQALNEAVESVGGRALSWGFDDRGVEVM